MTPRALARVALLIALPVGLRRGLDWETTGRVASLAGAVKIGAHGTQNHRLGDAGLADRFRAQARAGAEDRVLRSRPAGRAGD